jgi:hypothetical protein
MLTKIFLILLSFFILTVAQAQEPTRASPVQQAPARQLPDSSAYKNSAIVYKITDAANHTYGYDVFVDGKLMIHQASIPAMPGNDGFKSKEDAAKVANLVIEKIKKGEMPPTISVEELKKLKVIK